MDRLDQLLGEAVRSSEHVPRLVPGDQLGERYRIERLVGVGGMGAVYLATDPSLERRVAIKLHHARTGTERLHREAIAMARLAHPNVIAVFEVGEIGGQAFVAMEYIAGTTLRAWRTEPPRTTRAVIAMMIAAGEGLAAAHDAGLVHRDFKPENVLVGADGRPRVGDFGLARGSGEVSPIDPDATRTGLVALTQTGAVLGTPAYMAPEQMEGAVVDARADQFAFCVVAWELVFGERPFAGDSLGELGRAFVRGPRRPSRRVRASIRRVLERGLAVDAVDRHPDMHDLLATLRRANRSRVSLAIGGAAVLAAVSLAIALAPRSGPSCDDAGAEIAALPRSLADRVRAAGGPLAADGSARVAASVDRFAAAYRTTARSACRAAKIEHAWSADLDRRATACLAIRLRTASSLLTIDRVTAEQVPDLVQVALHLPVLKTCVDPAALAASPAPPRDPATYAQVVGARAVLDAAATQISLQRFDAARAAVAKLEHTPAALDPTVGVRMLFVRAGIAQADDHLVAGEELYRDAYFAARAIDDVEVLFPAVSALISSTGQDREDREAADAWIRNALADVERAKRRDPDRAAAVYTSAAEVRLLEDDPAEAARLAGAAVELVADTQSLVLADALLAASGADCAAGRDDACRAKSDRALQLARSLLGPHHPRIGRILSDLALERGDGASPEALALASEANTIIDASRESSSLDVARAEVTLASIIINDDAEARFPEARHMLEEARTRLSASLGAAHPDVAQVDSDLALLDNAYGDLGAGQARLERALAIQEAALGDATRVADTLYNLAATLRDRGLNEQALAVARRAIAINAKRRPGTTLHALSLAMAAQTANLSGDPAAALAEANRALALPVARDPVYPRGWALMEAGRAHALQGDPLHARPLLVEARAIFAAIHADPRAADCSALIAGLPR